MSRLYSLITVKEAPQALGKLLRLLKHRKMACQGEPLNVGVRDVLLQGLPLFRVDDLVQITVDAHGGNANLIKQRAKTPSTTARRSRPMR